MLLVVGAVIGFWYFAVREPATKTTSRQPAQTSRQTVAVPVETPKKGTLKVFTPQQFRDLYDNFAYPNTEMIGDKTPITGSETADEHIRAIAAGRGYELRSAPVHNVFVEVVPGARLQQRAAQPWLDMQAAAQKDGLNLGLSAAYRSADEQMDIFVSRLRQAGVNLTQAATGGYDLQIGRVLETTALPGYSRHHTGYTIDITCNNTAQTSFASSPCFTWLSTDNYKNAKTYGWIPSYPEGTSQQGPEPEAWEYVWVGLGAVTD